MFWSAVPGVPLLWGKGGIGRTLLPSLPSLPSRRKTSETAKPELNADDLLGPQDLAIDERLSIVISYERPYLII
jgi:hypothetical protein